MSRPCTQANSRTSPSGPPPFFLAGPMPRDISAPSWRPAMLEAIANVWTGPGTLAVFVPEARNWQPLKYDHHHWEDRWLSVVDVIVFWVPRDMQRLPGMNTNIEFGRWESSGRSSLERQQARLASAICVSARPAKAPPWPTR
jgi:hypothetical protein